MFHHFAYVLITFYYFDQGEKRRNLEEVDEVQDRHGELFEMEKQTWSIDKASDQRMVFVPKATVVEFMKKVRRLLR